MVCKVEASLSFGNNQYVTPPPINNTGSSHQKKTIRLFFSSSTGITLSSSALSDSQLGVPGESYFPEASLLKRSSSLSSPILYICFILGLLGNDLSQIV